jgi:predicted transcriptional regulator with HTH domain
MAATKQVKRYVYPVQLDETELEALDVITERLHLSKSDAIRDAVRNYAEQIKGLEVFRVREISRAQARKEILEFLNKRDRAWASEIADELRLDISFVNGILEGLWGEKRVEPTDH